MLPPTRSTSGRSSRLIHGGIRYLEHGEVGLVHECLRERKVLLRLAPHLVRPVPMYLLAPSSRARTMYGIGLAGYDLPHEDRQERAIVTDTLRDFATMAVTANGGAEFIGSASAQ